MKNGTDLTLGLFCLTDFSFFAFSVRESGLAVPEIRNRPADIFVNVCTAWGASSYADLAEADCARADVTTIDYATLVALKAASVVPDGPFN